MRIYGYVMKQMFCSRKYIFYILTAALLSFASVAVLNEFVDGYAETFLGISEGYRVGEHYNLLILSLDSLDSLQKYYVDDIVTGVLPGSFIQMLLVLLAAGFIYDAYNSGYLNYALMRGIGRRRLFNSYTMCSLLGIIPVVIIYESGVVAALAFEGRLHISEPLKVMAVIAVQLVLLAAFCTVIALIMLVLGNVYGMLLCICLVLTLPVLPNYIMMYSDGTINIEPIMILSLIQRVHTYSAGMNVWAVIVSLLTVAVVYLFCSVCFTNKIFK